MECGPVADVLRAPQHPYTRGLLEANVHPGQEHAPTVIAGSPPNLTRLPPGCSFAPRCTSATAVCWSERPQPQIVSADRWAACHHAAAQPVNIDTRHAALEVAS